jgi:hypothetical protein
MREQKLRDTNESTNERVKWFAFGKLRRIIKYRGPSLISNRNVGYACWAGSVAAGLPKVLLPQQALDLSVKFQASYVNVHISHRTGYVTPPSPPSHAGFCSSLPH